jgi:hypothetical protein
MSIFVFHCQVSEDSVSCCKRELSLLSMSLFPDDSLQTMKQTSTPQACAARNTAYVTVLFKILILHIITEGKAAIKAEGEIV